MDFIEVILGTIIIIIVCGIPTIITIMNLINIVKKSNVIEAIVEYATLILGLIFLASVNFMAEYNKSIMLDENNKITQLHTPISHKYISIVVILIFISIIGYYCLKVYYKKLSPVITACCFSALTIGIILNIVIILQLSKNIFNINGGGISFKTFYFMLFSFNFILSSIKVFRQITKFYVETKKIEGDIYKNKFLQFCFSLLFRSTEVQFYIFILLIPILPILLITLILFGQTPDAVIKAFTETSDWTLSQKISPPPVEYSGHYLCTVALNGHKNIVKPIRIGIRQDIKIIVNRQLCIANAFEGIIEEKMPKFHKWIRFLYDKYGYPMSNHINTKVQADCLYFIMKPLEWFFLLVIYTFDTKPENRIALQYTGKRMNLN